MLTGRQVLWSSSYVRITRAWWKTSNSHWRHYVHQAIRELRILINTSPVTAQGMANYNCLCVDSLKLETR